MHLEEVNGTCTCNTGIHHVCVYTHNESVTLSQLLSSLSLLPFLPPSQPLFLPLFLPLPPSLPPSLQSHNAWDVGEMVDRDYDWSVFSKSSLYGVPTPHDNSGSHVKDALHWMSLDQGWVYTTREVCELYTHLCDIYMYNVAHSTGSCYMYVHWPSMHKLSALLCVYH